MCISEGFVFVPVYGWVQTLFDPGFVSKQFFVFVQELGAYAQRLQEWVSVAVHRVVNGVEETEHDGDHQAAVVLVLGWEFRGVGLGGLLLVVHDLHLQLG